VSSQGLFRAPSVVKANMHLPAAASPLAASIYAFKQNRFRSRDREADRARLRRPMEAGYSGRASSSPRRLRNPTIRSLGQESRWIFQRTLNQPIDVIMTSRKPRNSETNKTFPLSLPARSYQAPPHRLAHAGLGPCHVSISSRSASDQLLPL